jgi:hypothetical protein
MESDLRAENLRLNEELKTLREEKKKDKHTLTTAVREAEKAVKMAQRIVAVLRQQ